MFCKSNDEENFLTRFGVTWRYSNKETFGTLVPGWDVVNFGRPKARVEDAMLEYAERSKATGSSGPAPVLRITGRQSQDGSPNGREVLDGVQRLGGQHLLNVTTFSAYLVETDSDLKARQIRVSANAILHGHQESPEWTRRQVVQQLIIEGKMSVEEVARMFGWNPKAVEEERVFLNTGFRIRCIGGPEGLTKGVILQLAEHFQSEDFDKAAKPISAFCQDLKTGKFTNGDVAVHIEKFCTVKRGGKLPLHQQFATRLEEFRADESVQVRLTDKRAPNHRRFDTNLLSFLKSAKTAADKLVAERFPMPYPEECFTLLNQIESRVRELQKFAKAAKR